MSRSLLVVGASRAGTGAGAALAAASGLDLLIWNRSVREGVDLQGEDALAEGIAASHGLVLAVRDDALDAVVATARRHLERLAHPPRFAIHLSGASGVDRLASLRDAGLQIGALHPLRTFHERRRDPDALRGVVCTLAGDVELGRRLEEWCALAGARVAHLDDRERVRYHAAAALASNGVVALFAAAVAELEAAGLESDAARQGLLRLAQGALEDIGAQGPERALTGPVVRGDAETLNRHLEHHAGDELTARTYRVLAELTLDLARNSGRLDADVHARLSKILERGG